jgi:hypothetical protein
LRRLAGGAAAVLLVAVPLVLTDAGSALADTPTAPPPVTILTSQGHIGRGDIFITPTGDTGTYANGPEILDSHGDIVWFHPIPQGETAADVGVHAGPSGPRPTTGSRSSHGGRAPGSAVSPAARTTSITTTSSR